MYAYMSISYDVTTTAYTFTDKPQTVTHAHASSYKSLTEVTTYSYDHADRLSKVQHKLDGGATVTLAEYTYDDLGRLQSKKLGGTAHTATFAYNIRGWLTGIDGGKFKQALTYNNGTAGYNGNITSMSRTANGTSHAYTFAYDGLNRLTDAVHGAGRYTEKVTAYDKNGNIKNLQRYGQTSAFAYGLVDNLTFTLNGNRLSRVDDAATASAYGNGFKFKDGAKQADEYAYDANGNLTKDLNKNITNIRYNFLNLSIYFSFNTGGFLQHGYTADGVRRRTIYKELDGPTSPVTTVYCGNVVYENNVPRLLLHEEGYVDLTDNSYHYYVKDHQGNNCLVVDSSGAVEEANHYYPFGGVFASTGDVQPYKYNGKKLDTEKGLNWYDYGARMYDAALGRFTTVDPLAEKYYPMSQYEYCGNNPILFVDKNGMEFGPGDLFMTKREAAKDWGMYYNGASIIRKREMGSSIYKVRENGKLKGYSYSAANEGEHSVSISLPPNNEEFAGSIHSHGDADTKHINNKFSKADIKYIEKTKENGYLATPSGELLEYNPYNRIVMTISSNLPSDPKDPQRKNNITPKDVPAEKGKQILEELYQKPNLNIPVYQQEKIHWTF
ncbi:MAG: hypothetical protein BACD_03681 [Bacteroides rodentium]